MRTPLHTQRNERERAHAQHYNNNNTEYVSSVTTGYTV